MKYLAREEFINELLNNESYYLKVGCNNILINNFLPFEIIVDFSSFSIDDKLFGNLTISNVVQLHKMLICLNVLN